MDVGTGSQIWGDYYERKIADILSVQEEIAREISEKLRLRLTGFEAIFLKVDPMNDDLRDDPRFAALLRKAGLSP